MKKIKKVKNQLKLIKIKKKQLNNQLKNKINLIKKLKL